MSQIPTPFIFHRIENDELCRMASRGGPPLLPGFGRGAAACSAFRSLAIRVYPVPAAQTNPVLECLPVAVVLVVTIQPP
jgi:hypothetical protein